MPNAIILTISLYRRNELQSRKFCSIEPSFISHVGIIRLINSLFGLNSNFTLSNNEHCLINDDFDLDNHLLDTNKHELRVEQYDIEDWCIIEENQDENFHLIDVQNDCFVVTNKANIDRQETLFQRATSWFQNASQSKLRKALSKNEFRQMFEHSTGRLINEPLLRQRVFESGSDPSIRHVVWCYLFRVYDRSMSSDDRAQCAIKNTERYLEMKTAWQTRQDSDIENLKSLIEKDVMRTDNSMKYFEKNRDRSQEKLLHLLVTYCVYHPQPGYSQGMTDMASPILYVIRDEPMAYACFCALMRHMAPLFYSDAVAINRRLDLLRKTIRAIDNELWTEIEQCGRGNLMFAYRWLLLDCKREFPFKDIFYVFESLWASLSTDRFDLTDIAVSIDHEDITGTFQPCYSRQTSTASSTTSHAFFSSRSTSPILDEIRSEHSSLDEVDSGYPDEPQSPIQDLHSNVLSNDSPPIPLVPTPLGTWLQHFTAIDDQNIVSDMFTIFLCIGILQQNRSSIMKILTAHNDDDDRIDYYFTRLVRKNDAQQALQLARHYYRQYIIFQRRLKQLVNYHF